jgi:hypothetical protein
VSVDVDAEDVTEYGAPAIKEFFSRWIPQFGRSLAERVADRHLAMFRDPPHEIRLKVHVDQADSIHLAGYLNISTADVQDDTGDLEQSQIAVIAIERDEHEIELTARTVTFEDPFVAGEERVIHIENDASNLNLRSIHDLLYSEPEVESPSLRVLFVVDPGVLVESTSTDVAALVTGSWPDGVSLSLTIHGRILGKGGQGGGGGNGTVVDPPFGSVFIEPGDDGAPGGTALQVTVPITLDNSNGQIWGGGGGGGGGAAAMVIDITNGAASSGGGGGGGGGTGTGGFGGGGSSRANALETIDLIATSGTVGTTSAGGSGGTAGQSHNDQGTLAQGGAGGAGGGPGLAGSNGSVGTVFIGPFDGRDPGIAGSGGAAGKYIDGISFVTFSGSPVGDLRGNVS